MNETKTSSPASAMFAQSLTPNTHEIQSNNTPSTRNQSVVKDRYDSIYDWVQENIARRQRELEEDLQQNVVIENRILSGQLSSIPGIQRHLSHAKVAKTLYESQVVSDAKSHGTMTRAELNRKYHYHLRK